MTQSPRAWYQNGWTVSFIVFVLLPVSCHLYQDWQRTHRPYIVPRFSVAVVEPPFGAPYLDLEIWHQHTADLQNGMLSVYMVDPAAEHDRRRKEQEDYSFVRWPPNKDHAINFHLPLPDHQAGAETRFVVGLKSRSARDSLQEFSLVDDQLELVRDYVEEYRQALEDARQR